MVLSDRTIRREIEAGNIDIDPLGKDAIQPASVDLRLGNLFRVFRNSRDAYIDVKKEYPDLTELVEITDDRPFILHPGDRLVLYTDGIERPNEPADGVALRLVAEYGGETPESITEHFAEGMRSGAAGNADDLAVVVIAVGDPGLRPLGRLARAVQRMNVF